MADREKKVPVHDFAPSWLKINSFEKDYSNTSNKKLENNRFSTSGLGGGEDSFDLRPQYLKQRDINNKDTSSSSSSSSHNSHSSHHQGNHHIGAHSTTNTYLNSNWSNNNRRYTLKNKIVNSSTESGDDSLSSPRRSINNLRSNDGGAGSRREDIKSNSRYLHHHHHHNTHHSGNNKEKLNSPRVGSPPISGDASGESFKSKSNTKNGFVDSNKFKEEFPSLIDEKQVNIETNNGNNVWDNVANKVFRSGSSKVSLVSRHLGSSLYGDKGPRSLNSEKSANDGPSYFRTLVPVVPKRKTVNGINGSSSGSKENTTRVNNLSNLSLGSTNKILPVFTKPVDHSSSGHSMAILVKKHPKMRSNKNEFCSSTVRSSSSDSRPSEEEQRSNDPFDDDEERAISSCLEESNDGEDEEKSKGDRSIGRGEKLNDENNDNESCHLLSSSLEAEERLLREMGWKEEDGDDILYAPLTEDEVKEFKDLINTMTSFKRLTSSKINQGQFKFQANSNQLPLSQLNFLNSISTQDKDKDETDSTSEQDDDDDDDDEKR